MADVSLRIALAALAPKPPEATSVDAILKSIGLVRPVGCSDLAATMSPVQLRSDLNTGTCHGFCEISFEPDGHTTYSGHVHNTGIVDTVYTVITSIPMPAETGSAVIVAHKGTAGGTFDPFQSRDDKWQEVVDSKFVASNWLSLRHHSRAAKTEFGTGTGLFEAFMTALGASTPTWLFRI